MIPSIFSISVIFLVIEISSVISSDQKIQEGIPKEESLESFRSISSRVKDTNTHFLFQIHDAIHGLHAHYLSMLMSEVFMQEQHGMNSNISQQCMESLMDFSRGLKEKRIWALMMIDSCGNIPSGILEGTFHSAGDFRQCMDADVLGKFQGQHCEVGFLQKNEYQHHSNPLEPLDLSYIQETDESKVWDFDEKFPNGLFPVTTSICLPSKCSVKDVELLVSKATIASEENLKIKTLQCLVKSQWQYTTGQKIAMTIIIAFITLEVIGTMMDIRSNTSQDNKTNISETNFLEKTLLCLSLRKSFLQLVQKDPHAGLQQLFHGIKVLMTLFARYIIITSPNPKMGRFRQNFRTSTSFFGSVLRNIYPLIDSFFFGCGFAALYSIIKSPDSSTNIFQNILQRYLRLCLPIVFIYGTSIFFLDMVEPMALKAVEHIIVKQNIHWWKNALCINNLFPVSEQFFEWTWLFSAEIQLYIAAHFIFLICRRNPEKAMNVFKIIIAVTLAFMAYLIYYHEWQPLIITAYTKPSAVLYLLENRLYPTYFYIVPYCMGILTCDIVVNRKYSLIFKEAKSLGWFLSAAAICVIWFVPYIWNGNRLATMVESVIFGSLYRFLWTIVLGWIIFTYSNGDRGIIASVLSWEGFTIPSRLTFMVNLSYQLVQNFMGQEAMKNLPNGVISGITSTLVSAAFTYCISFILYLVCQAPLDNLITLLFMSVKRKTEAKKSQ